VGALDGLTVVELGGGIASAYATKLLADLGASVGKVGPGRADGLGAYLDAGKTLIDVAVDADIVVEDLGPGGLEATGPATTGAVVRISPFGQSGPRADQPATDLTVQASGGWVSNHGIPGLDPVRTGGRAPAYVAGGYAAAAALTAHRTVAATGEPVVVDLSIQACLIGTLPYPMLFQFTLDRMGQRFGERRYVVPGIVPCADGHVGINCLTGQHWLDVCSLLGLPQWEDRQREVVEDTAYADFLADARPWLDGRGAEEIVGICQALRIPAAPIGNGANLPGLSQFAERGFYAELPGTDVVAPVAPYRLSATPARPGPTPAAGTLPESSRSAATGSAELPFAGLKVVDLSIFWSAPYLSMYLGSLGADVVKVESVQRPDGFRYSASFPELGADWYERSLVWQATNLSKKDITLDLTRPEGQDLLWRLLDGADVLIENFSPRVVESFGLSEDAVGERRPELIYLRMPGFGLVGPWRDHVGWAMVYEQACGLAQVTGFPDGPPLNPGGFADPVVGMHAAVALQAALRHRDRTGEGQLVEVAQVEVMAAVTAEQVITAAATGLVPGRTGNQSDEAEFEGVYEAEDGWVAVSVRDAEDQAALDRALGPTDEETLAGWIAERSAAEAADAVLATGVPASVVLTVPGMLTEPQLAARSYYQPLTHPLVGEVPYPGWPMSFSAGVPEHHRWVAPTLGQDNDEVLGGRLGLSADELAALRDQMVIGESLR
jgi:crotonobetainyl-CoA:carnitine CoA-transferase CaiB-like acyl-CoA transferase